TVWAGKSTAIRAAGSARRASRMRAWNAASTAIGKRPFFIALPLKMSANDGAMMARRPPPDEPPGRVLARRAAAEILARHEDLGPLRVGAVQREVGIDRSFGQAAPVGEDAVAEALLVRHLQEARRDDLVGVDVVGREHDERRRQR